jgi:diguanylate cyclase (GGDEF)-like protein
MKQYRKDLFAHEQEILDHADAILRDGTSTRQALLNACRTLLESYGAVLSQTERIFRISDMTSAEVKRTEVRLKALLDNSNQGFLTVDRNLRVEKEYSSECDRIFGQTISGLRLDLLLGERSEGMERDLTRRLETLFATDSLDERQALCSHLPGLLTINGNSVAVEYKFITSPVDVDDTKLMLILTDISEKKKAEEQIRYLSYYDKLTGLFNRGYAEGRIPDLQADNRLPIGIIVCDIDGLKLVNDLFGHRTGDDLIRTVAGILKLGARRDDIIARWGGDEFLILLSCTDAAQCQRICRRIEENCRSQDTFPLNVHISSGYSTIDDRETSFEDAFVRADAMMYADKHVNGGNKKKDILTGIPRLVRARNESLARRLDGFTHCATRFLRCLNMDAGAVSLQDMTMLWMLNNLESIVSAPSISGETISRALLTIGEPSLPMTYACLNARWDGRGSGSNPSGANIPLISRVFCILDGLCSSIDQGRSPDQALDLILMESGKKYDPRLVGLLVECSLARQC